MGWCQGPCSGPRFGGRISAPSSLGDPHNKHYRLLLSYIDYTHMHTTHTHTSTHIPPHTHKRTVQYLWFFDWTSMFIMKNPPQALLCIYILCADFVLGKNIVKFPLELSAIKLQITQYFAIIWDCGEAGLMNANAHDATICIRCLCICICICICICAVYSS